MVVQGLALLAGHFVGDYGLQTGYMAQMKGKDWYVLTAHVITYTAAVWVLSAVTATYLGGTALSVWGLVLIFVAHFIADAAKGQWNMVKSIAVDQTIHLATLLVALFI